MSIFFRSLLIGISIAAPVGPIGVLCIRRTLVEGRLSGLVSGLGAASADAIYGIIAGFSITLISNFLVTQQSWLRLIGGLFLCYLGIRTFLSPPVGSGNQTQGQGFLRNYFSVFILTLTNPMTILSFAAVFAGLGLAQGNGDYKSALLMVGGVFSGSALWWLILSQGVGFFGNRTSLQRMGWINRLSGCVLIAFGVLALISLVSSNSPL
jgi:threonine/homoserine/homoserine lactone efflux protein